MKRFTTYIIIAGCITSCYIPDQSIGNIKTPNSVGGATMFSFYNRDTVSLQTFSILLIKDISATDPYMRATLKIINPSGEYWSDTLRIDLRLAPAKKNHFSQTEKVQKDIYHNIQLKEQGEYLFEIKPLEKEKLPIHQIGIIIE